MKNTARIISLMLLFCLMLTACGLPEPADTVERFFAGVQDYDFAEVETTLGEGTTIDDIRQLIDSDESREILSPAFRRMDWTVLESAVDTRLKTAVVTVELETVDLGSLLMLVRTDLELELIVKATEGATFTQEEIQVMLVERMVEAMGNQSATVTETLAIDLVYQDKAWGIIFDEALVGALTGHMSDAVDLMTGADTADDGLPEKQNVG